MYRFIVINTKNITKELKKTIVKDYNDKIREAHKRLLRIKMKSDDYSPLISLIGLDGSVKKSYKTYNKSTLNNIFKLIDKMPLGYLKPGMQLTKTKKQPGLSLYADYNPKTTLKGTGFKDSKTAKNTIKLIKDRDLAYQKRVIQTMYNRAKFHPHRTENMVGAMDIYKKWLDKH